MDHIPLSMLVILAVLAVGLAFVHPRMKRRVSALAVWVVASALDGRSRRRNTGLAKLMWSAVMVLAFSMGLRYQNVETQAFLFAVWVALSMLRVLPCGKFTGGAELLRDFGMGLFGCFALRYPRIETYALALAVWTPLLPFYRRLETLERDGPDTASMEVGSSSSISSLAKKELRVFLSFNRGPDIPDVFIDFLMAQLTRSGISVFGDGKKLPEGEDLVEVIKRSNISIPIISKGYASSEGCFVELGVMLECRRTNGQTIIPIFYDVDPSDVRHVRGSFEISLKDHEMKGTDGRTIHAWGRALREVGGLERFYSADNNSWSNYKLLKQFLLDVLQLFGEWDVEKNLVGIQDRVQEVMTKLGVNYKDGQSVGLHGGDVRVVGIYGTGGVGKTTLAKVVYKDIASLFDGCSYLEDIQERFTQSEGLKSLQNQLISNLLKRSCPMFTCEEGAHIIRHRFHSMRVLIILDDVNYHHQLEPFIGKLSWFGPRSRIIVTTQDYSLINIPEVAERYEVEPLKPDQALFLFRRHASHVLQFPKGHDSSFDEIISVTGRIPLAIEVLAPLLCRTPTTLWRHTLKRMRKHVDPVECVLMASFEFLNYETKEILLDIACFFVGKDIANPFAMWCACGYDPLSGIKVLLDMSLVEIGDNNKLWMHNKLRNLCQQIVKIEDLQRPERCSRLWNHADAASMLKKRKGTKRVQALNLEYDNICHDRFTCEEFEHLPGLRFLKLGKARIIGDSRNSLSNLRWLDWQVCPETFGACDLHLKELVILDLSWSKVAHDCKGWSQIKMPQLRILNLTGCISLLMTPDFSGFEKLEILILEHCSRLVKIDASIAHLKFLVTLNLKFCSELSMLPKELNDMKEMKELLIDGTSIKEIPGTLANMKKLKILSASNCFSLSSLPQSMGQLEALSVLLLDSAKIVVLPDSIGELMQLKQLSLRNCRCLGELPDSIGKLGRSLIELDVSGTGICDLPVSIMNLQSLEVLKMDSCFIREFPRDIGRLTNLKEMHALRCRSLEGDIPSDIGELKSLRMLVLGYTRISSLPSCIRSLCCLQTLDLLNCDRIEALPMLSSSLTRLRVISRNMKVVPFIDNLTKLEELCLGDEDPDELKLPSMQRRMNSILTRVVVLSFLWPKRFPRLKVLELSHSWITDLRLCNESLPQLTKLVVSGANLRRVTQLPSTLSFLSVRGCLLLKRLPTVQCLKSLTELRLSHSAVREVEGLGELEALEIVDISHCEIRNLKGLGHLTSLRSLTLSDCDHLRKLPDISNLRMLKILEIRRCREIKNIPGLQEIRSPLEKLPVGECKDEDSPEVGDDLGLQEIRSSSEKLPVGECKDEDSREVGDDLGLQEIRSSLEKLPVGECKDEDSPEIGEDLGLKEIRSSLEKLPVGECKDEDSPENNGKSTLRKADDLGVSSSSATSIESNIYHVFLGFRGLDTRTDFVDHLYHGLVNAGFSVFRDNHELPKGENFGPNLHHAIKNSKISMPVLSRNYASSKYCLQELALMVECMKSGEHIILPIFYDVKPADVRYQKGIFGENFSRLSGKCDKEDVDKWTQALRETASLNGWDSKTAANGREGELVKQVVTRTWSELKKAFQLVVTEQPVGIDNAVEEVLRLLNDNPNATKIVGIHGMGGIGKTTLAKVVYNKLSDQFQHRSFIADIRESSQVTGILSLQNQLIGDLLKIKGQVSNTDEGIQIMESRWTREKVLILLDDVDHEDQLKPLVGKHGWFERGSRIIITTRTKSVLKNDDEVNCNYELKELDVDQSLILFSRHAFLKDSPPHEFASLSHDIISTTGGLPLALEVIGSFLCGKDSAFWQRELMKLKEVPPKDVQKKLMICYDTLEPEEKEIFLDIACFFIGTDVRIASYMWDACKLFLVGIDKLSFVSLIKIGDNHELRMHDQLRDLGRRIASQGEPTERSRLWVHDKALEVLRDDKENRKTEALCLNENGSSKFMEQESFKRLPNLRFLHLTEVDFVGDFENTNLRWLEWERCHDSFKATNVHLEKLLILDLSGGFISETWRGWTSIKMERLKVLNLSGCSHLKSTRNLSALESLEMLILKNCENLEEIHPSIKNVKCLISLNLGYCGSLEKIPEQLGELEKLEELLVDETDIREIPPSIGSLERLKTLSAMGCRLLTRVPSSVSRLVSLSTLNLNACKKLQELPGSIEALGELQRLSLERCYMLKRIPSSIGKLKKLVELDLSSTRIKELPESIGELNKLKILRISHSEIERLPSSIGNLRSLREFDASGCHKLKGQILVDKGGLCSLRTLRLGRANISCLPDKLRELSALQYLDLLYCSELQSLPEPPSGLSSLQLTCRSSTVPSLFQLSYLKELTLHSCMSLQSIPELPSCIRKLRVLNCPKLERLSNLSEWKSLSELELLQCYGLKKLDGLEALESLRKLDVSTSTELSNLNDFEDLESLRYWDLQSYDEEADHLHAIGGLEKLGSLEVLNISGRKHIQQLNLSSSKDLKQLIVYNCKRLDKIDFHKSIKSLERFDTDGCKSLSPHSYHVTGHDSGGKEQQKPN